MDKKKIVTNRQPKTTVDLSDFDINDVKILVDKDAIPYSLDCKKIFNENNQGHIANREGIYQREKFHLVVAIWKKEAVGYQIIYEGGDFVKQEGFVNEYLNDRKFEDTAMYVWDICTKKGYEGRGIQKKLYNFVENKFPTSNFYSITDKHAEHSVKLQLSLGYKTIEGKGWDTEWNKQLCSFDIYKKPAKIATNTEEKSAVK